ncbi:A-kinase anchor protein 6 [Merluccius polli]|uniref:A-kinase anchor protein 6 n=1 Tax=Merluccius polli TaxID=89951 RepID=A0AA47LYZ3_MERPO|nr:A-kinase anchor protein 6 [Merluccius polli]
MSVIALSPIVAEPPSPMITSVTPTTSEPQEEATPPGLSCRQRRAPPLHGGADWKVVLHLPEVQTWLRATRGRVSQLTHSAAQDTQHRHVDTHLLQLKDICEDISDHVEQIHALLETEFSLKLLSYSVNILVDIRSVQLLWHQLRVSVLVLKERLLQGLQDSNGNFTRQTDILQAFTQDQTRLDELTEVDDSGQLTIRCSQDYFSLDCGITAFELSDYSPGDSPLSQDHHHLQEPSQDLSLVQDPDSQTHSQDPNLVQDPETQTHCHPEATPTNSSNSTHCAPNMHCGASHQSDASMSKRPLLGGGGGASTSALVAVPGQGMMEGTDPGQGMMEGTDPGPGVMEGTGRHPSTTCPPPRVLFHGEESLRSPSLLEPQQRSTFWLELDSVYPETTAQTCGGGEGNVHGPQPTQRPSTETPLTAQNPTSSQSRLETRTPSRGDSALPPYPLTPPLPSDSALPSPNREALSSSSDMEASGEESDPRAPPAKLTQRPGQQVKDHWFGSEEFLALPDQLRQTELLAINLESLTHVLPLSSGCELDQQGLQDIDDWDLTEATPDCYLHQAAGDSSDDIPYRQSRHHHFNISRFSPSSSSDIAPSLDESIESGPLSELLSEEEGRSSGSSAPLVASQGTTALVSQLLAGIQLHEPNIWKKTEANNHKATESYGAKLQAD